MSGNNFNNVHSKNKKDIFLILLKSHFEISYNSFNEEHVKIYY